MISTNNNGSHDCLNAFASRSACFDGGHRITCEHILVGWDLLKFQIEKTINSARSSCKHKC